MEQKIYFKNSENLKLAGILHIPKYKKEIGIIICHGFTGSKDKNFIPELARNLERNNFLVLRFDFSGNGESEGKFEERTYSKYVEDLKSAIDWFREQIKKICVIGHSMGGSIALIEYSKYKNYDKIILLAPGIKIIKKSFTKVDFEKLEKQGYIDFIDSWGEKRRLTKQYFEDRESYNQIELGKNLDIPALIIVGDNDESVSVDKCRELFQILPSTDKKLKILKNEDHVFHNKSNKILKYILEFL
ncbi:MAG: alpha/beta fold hydrolase [Candidatus Aenigmarchaeota archaeon]|nr:alpha/beta fold hydrolase [Candidatus Aenigmarchaeota archaeon]